MLLLLPSISNISHQVLEILSYFIRTANFVQFRYLKPSGDLDVGENLAYGCYSEENMELTPTEAVKSWYAFLIRIIFIL